MISHVDKFIGSKGYLLFFEANGLMISIRIALWVVIMSVWLGIFLVDIIKTKRLNILKYTKIFDLKYLFILFAFILWGLVNGILNNNGYNSIFFDSLDSFA